MVISSSSAQVWKVDPSDGSLFVVTKRLQIPTENVSGHGHTEERPCRRLQVGVASAELSPAMTGKTMHGY